MLTVVGFAYNVDHLWVCSRGFHSDEFLGSIFSSSYPPAATTSSSQTHHLHSYGRPLQPTNDANSTHFPPQLHRTHQTTASTSGRLHPRWQNDMKAPVTTSSTLADRSRPVEVVQMQHMRESDGTTRVIHARAVGHRVHTIEG